MTGLDLIFTRATPRPGAALGGRICAERAGSHARASAHDAAPSEADGAPLVMRCRLPGDASLDADGGSRSARAQDRGAERARSRGAYASRAGWLVGRLRSARRP